jgi:hypothetical protein
MQGVPSCRNAEKQEMNLLVKGKWFFVLHSKFPGCCTRATARTVHSLKMLNQHSNGKSS